MGRVTESRSGLTGREDCAREGDYLVLLSFCFFCFEIRKFQLALYSVMLHF